MTDPKKHQYTKMDRRHFLKAGAAMGGGLLISFYLPGGSVSSASSQTLAAATTNGRPGQFSPNAWLRIAADNAITIIVDKSEMGQGVMTALPMILAEELEADWSLVHTEFAPADPVYANPLVAGIQQTVGSTAIPAGWDTLRLAGATARQMMIAAAAARLDVPLAACKAENSKVVHTASGRSLSYGELASQAAKMAVPKNVPLKHARDYKLIGKPIARLDTPAKTNGEAIFGIDVKLPGLLTAAVVHPPVFGSKVKSFDATKAETLPGVKQVLAIAAGIAVVADTFWHANQAASAIDIMWTKTPNDNLDDAAIGAQWVQRKDEKGVRVRDDGDVDKVLSKAAKLVTAVYETPYQAHGVPEPRNCTADVRKTECEVWVPTQNQTFAHQTTQDLTGFTDAAITIHTTFLGGGFGGRYHPDIVAEAVQISQAVGAPVKVIWNRKEDIQQDNYHPAALIQMKAGLSSDGNPLAWSHHLVAPSHMAKIVPLVRYHKTPNWLPAWARSTASSALSLIVDKKVFKEHATKGAVHMPYSIENVAVSFTRDDPGIPTGNWRSVAHAYNAFAIESFIDELATSGGKDPVEFRRALLSSHPRLVHVLDLAVKMSGWGKPVPDGTGLGIAVHDYKGTRVAQVARVSVTPQGKVKVINVYCAVDCGIVVNPKIVVAQMRGAIAFGLTAALKSAITIKNGRVEQSNFHDFPILGMHEMPKVGVQIVKSAERPTGIGETGVPPIAPAVANAVFAATGKRVRRLPIKPEDLI